MSEGKGKGLELKAAKKLVERNLPRILRELRVSDWRVEVTYEKLPLGVAGECCADPAYRHANVRLDPIEADSEEAFLQTVRHEVLHIVLAEFETFRRSCFELTPSRSVDDALDVVWRHAQERTVGLLERILDGLESQ